MFNLRDELLEKIHLGEDSHVIRFDETPVSRAPMSDLDGGLWRRFLPFQRDEADEVVLNKLAMAARDESGHWHPTVAGLLMGSRVAHHYLSGSFIQAVAYGGTDALPNEHSTYQLDARNITGPLDQQIFEACNFVRKNMRVSAYKHPQGGREDRPQFDILAVFEAVTNAVAHRDYSMAGAKVRLRLFANRLELFSPGMLPNTMTPDSLPYRQAARNEALTSLLARCRPHGYDPHPDDDVQITHRRHIMDKRGEGVSLILTNSERLSGKRPEYRLMDDSELMLTIYAAG